MPKRARCAPASVVMREKDDVWLGICAELYTTPLWVFRLMSACKNVWQLLHSNTAWWEAFYERVLQYHDDCVFSHYTHWLHHFRSHTDKRAALQLLFIKACTDCGARNGRDQRVLLTLCMPARLCQGCSQERLVSNRVLLLRYGLHYSDILPEYHAKGGLLIMRHQHRKHALSQHNELLRLTCAPIDFEYWRGERLAVLGGQPWSNSRLLFFRKRDLELILSLSLPQLQHEQQLRLAAIARLGAHMRMSNVQRTLTPDSVAAVVARERLEAVRHSLNPRHPEAAFMMLGGPYLVHARPWMYGFRKGHSQESVAQLTKILGAVQRQQLPAKAVR